MLEAFRKFSKHILFKILFGLLLLSFALSGVTGLSHLSLTPDHIVKVGGEYITAGMVDTKYEDTVRNVRRSGLDFSDEQLAAMGISKTQILRTYIQESLLRQEVNDFGIEVNDAAIADQIKSFPQFQTDGKFDRNKFNESIGSVGMNETKFTRILRDEIRNNILMGTVTSNVPVNNIIAEKQARHYSEERDVELVIINKEFPRVTQTPVDKDLEDFYFEHSYEFQIPEKRSIAYVKLPRTTENEKTIYDTTTKIEDELAGGSTLAEIANKMSLKLEKSENLVRENEDFTPLFVETAFGKNKGEISDLVLDEKDGDKGAYYVIEVTDVSPARIPELKEVREQAIEAWRDDETNRQNLKYIGDLAKELAESKEDFRAFAGRTGYRYEILKSITRGDTEEYGARLVNDSFSGQPGDVVGSFQNEDGTYKIARLRGITQPEISAADVEKFKSQLAATNKVEIVDQYFEALKKKYPVKQNPKLVKKAQSPVNEVAMPKKPVATDKK